MDRKPVQTLIKNKMRMNMYITFNGSLNLIIFFVTYDKINQQIKSEIDNEVFELYKKEYETKDVFLSANTSWVYFCFSKFSLKSIK